MPRTSKSWVVFLALVALAGFAAWLYQLRVGLIATNMRNSYTWGLYIATWAFFVGTAAGGLVVSSAIYVFGATELKPIAKVASLTAFLFAGAALSIVLPDLGRPERALNLLLHPNFTSMLFWDAVVLSSYAMVSAIYSYVQLRPAIRERGVTIPGLGVIGKRNLTKEQLEAEKQRSERWAKRLAPVALPLAVAIHTVTAWVLATQLGRPWWFGGALAPTFIAAALATGPAVVLIASFLVYGYRWEWERTYRLLARIAILSAIVLLFIYYNDFFVKLWWNGGREAEVVKLMFRDYLSLHVTEIVLILLGIFVLATKASTAKGLTLGSVAMILGVYVHRLLLIPPAYNYIPLRVPVVTRTGGHEWAYPIAVGEIRGATLSPQQIFVNHWAYFPSWIEIAIVAGVMAGLVLVFLALVRSLPIAEPQR
jgi:molybdopterin-containing oxidoreductase family membrane subunit